MILTIEGQLTPDDVRQLKPCYFDVPEGTTQIHFNFKSAPKHPQGHEFPHQLSLMICDPNGPCLSIYRAKEEGATINAVNPSPGGVPAPIQPGKWTIFVLVYRLLTPEPPVNFTLEITLSTDEIVGEPQVWEPGKTALRGPGWYRGDLHAHSIHSDGSLDIPELVQIWRDRKVDFMTLSDHDTISGLGQARSLSDDELLIMGGSEISTFRGHAVAVGVHEWFDWRTLEGKQIPVPEIARRVIDSGALFTIVHPRNEGEPWCCGCRWLHKDMMPGNALAIEIWNGYWDQRNEEALRLFYSWLDQGHRIVATSGSDIHRPPSANKPGHGAVNVVYAQDLTENAIIAGIKAGCSYISAGPKLIFTAKSESGIEAMLGDTLPTEPVELYVRWENANADSVLRLIVDGMPYAETPINEFGELRWQLKRSLQWCVVELRQPSNGLWAVTNPIFFER